MGSKLAAAYLWPIALASAGAAVAFACGGSSGTDDDTPDASSSAASACVYQVRTVYDCPGEPVAPTPWATECIDRSDCSGLAPTTQQTEGCTATTQIQDAVTVTGTCTQLAATTSPTTTEAGAVVLDAGGAGPCTPDDASSFSPTWHPPRAKQPGACTSAIVLGFLQCLDDSATTANPASCQAYASPTTQVATCLSCLQSEPSDPSWGPLILLPNESLLNIAGCLALADNATNGGGCAGALQADEECDRFACVGSCPLGSASSTSATAEIAAEEACEELANLDGGSCASYVDAASCAGFIARGDAGTSAEQACFGLPTGTTDAIFQALAAAFCE